jgi:hypothetical protein
MDWNDILGPVVVEAVNTVVLPVALAAITAGVAWLGVRVNRLLGVNIDTQLNALLHAALTRAVAAMVVKYGPAASPAVIAEQLRTTNPDSAGKIKPEVLRQLVVDEIARQTAR